MTRALELRRAVLLAIGCAVAAGLSLAAPPALAQSASRAAAAKGAAPDPAGEVGDARAVDPLGEKRSAAPDASLAGSIEPGAASAPAAAAPALDFEAFRYKVEGQVSGKRRQEMADLEKLVRLGGDESEMPGWLFRLAELHWEESRYLFFEANRRDDAIARAGGPGAPAAARLRLEKQELERRSRAEQQRAIDRYREIVRRYPGWQRLDEVVFFLGENLWKQDRRAEALEAYRALLTKYPKSRFVPDAWIAVGESWFDLAERSDRVVNLRRALEAYRRAAAQTGSSVTGYALYKQAWALYNLGEWEQALEKFEEVIRRGAPSAEEAERSLALAREARKDYVRTYVHVGSPKDAFERFRRVAGDQHAREMMKGLAGLYFENGKDRAAILTYHRLLQDDPATPDGPLFQARIVTAAGRLGKKDLAAAQARELVAVFERARASPAAKAEEGSQALEAASREAENTIRTLAVQYHNEWKKTGDRLVAELAESLYRDHLLLFPDRTNAHDLRFFHAELLFALGKHQEAGDEYTRVADAALAPRSAPGARPRFLVESLEGAVHAYAEVAKRSAARDRKPVAGQARIPFATEQQQLVSACERYLRHAPRGDKSVEVAYQAAQLYYQHNALAESVPLFTRIATEHPRHELARYAANLALDALNLAGSYREMNRLARRFYDDGDLLAAHPALKEDLRRVVEQSAFKLVEELEKAGKKVEAAEAWLVFARDWRSSKLAPTALHNAAVNLAAAGRLEAAMAARAELLERYPDHALAPKALAASAQDHAAAADFERAAELFERYYAEWKRADGREKQGRQARGKRSAPAKAAGGEAPKWEESVARDAIHDAGILREGLGQYRKAEQDRLAFLASWPSAKEAPRIFLSIADLHAKENAPQREVRHLREYQRKYARDPDDWLAAQHRIVRALERAGDRAGARRAALEALAYFKRRTPKVSERGLAAVAQGMLLDLEDDFAAYDRIRFDGGPAQLESRLAEKARRLEALQRAYVEIVELKQPEPAVCALWKIGDAYLRFAAALRDAPLPRELRGDPKLAAQYRAELARFAAEPERKGLEGTELAVAKARELSVDNACAREALAAAVKLEPAEYGPPVEALPAAAERSAPRSLVANDAAPGLDLERELSREARSGDDDPSAMLREAEADLEAGRPESAWRRVRLALLRAPGASPRAYPLLMRAALQQGKPDLAHLVALRADRSGKPSPEITYLRGRAYQIQQQEALARAEWLRAAEAGHDAARRALLRVEFQNRNWPAVEVHARALAQRYPDDAVAQLALGVARRYSGRADDALAAYDAAEKLAGGTLAEVHFARAILLARVKADCDAAATELRRYAQLAGAAADGSAGATLRRDCERARPAASAAPGAIPAAVSGRVESVPSTTSVRAEGTPAEPQPSARAPAAPAHP